MGWGSGIRKKTHPGSRSQKAPNSGSGSATLILGVNLDKILAGLEIEHAKESATSKVKNGKSSLQIAQVVQKIQNIIRDFDVRPCNTLRRQRFLSRYPEIQNIKYLTERKFNMVFLLQN
jgi:hypothetical protein